ncbi:hypothetical protein Tco_0961508 [Tanacetum coccineum]
METIHVKFDELTPMAFECKNSEHEINNTNFQDSTEDSQSMPSKTDLDNLFGPQYEEYYATSSPEVSDNSAANTLDNENTSSSSLIVVEEDEAPQIVSSSAEQVATEPTLYFCLSTNGFVDLDFPNHVYRLKKALYGLKQAPRAWSTKPVFSTRFAKLMKDNFDMSMIGEMKFFLRLQVRIYQKSQENSQKRASTDTRTEECTKARSKAKKSQNLSQIVKGKSTHGQQKDRSVKSKDFVSSLLSSSHVAMEKAYKDVGFVLILLREETQDQEERGHQAWPRTFSARL